jgi:hypothetical protein
MAQYFLMNVLGGSSIGRACLQARQKFVQAQKMENPANLKTVAQFILLGDPSLQPVRTEQAEVWSTHIDFREARRARRVTLAAFGNSAAACSGFPGARIAHGKTELHRLVMRIARQRGLKVESVEAYEIIGRERYAKEMKRRGVRQQVFVATHRESSRKKAGARAPTRRLLVAHVQNDRVTDISEHVQI